MRALEADGLLRDYTALIDHASMGATLEAFTELRFAGTTQVDHLKRIIDRIRRTGVVTGTKTLIVLGSGSR